MADMAARLNPRNTESVLAKIKADQLIEKLQNHALEQGEMEKSQVTAATWLLSRILSQAEAPKNIHLTGELTLSQLVEQASGNTG